MGGVRIAACARRYVPEKLLQASQKKDEAFLKRIEIAGVLNYTIKYMKIIEGSDRMNKKRMGVTAALALLLAFCISASAFATGVSDGFLTQGGATYYYQDGKMQKGWKEIAGKKYFFCKDGKMAVGRLKVGKTTYYFNTKGVCVKKLPNAAWVQDENGRRYCDGADKYLKGGCHHSLFVEMINIFLYLLYPCQDIPFFIKIIFFCSTAVR